MLGRDETGIGGGALGIGGAGLGARPFVSLAGASAWGLCML